MTMATSHDRLSRICMNELLNNWRTSRWPNTAVSENVFGVITKQSWPSPDGSFFDLNNEISIGIEFKPHAETRRGIQTGIGQCITYLENFSMSYLICPRYVEGFNIEDYLKKVFKNEVHGKLPVGLITYDINNLPRIEKIIDISKQFIFKKSKESDFFTNRYWAKYNDTCPDLIFKLLDIAASAILDEDNRKEQLWQLFFDTTYFPFEARNKLKPFDSTIKLWDKGFMRPFETKIKDLSQMVKSKKISKRGALAELNQHTSNEGTPKLQKSTSDNLFKSYKKNYLPFIGHLGLWDNDCRLTTEGIELYHVGKLYGGNSVAFTDSLAKIILLKGRHLDLILDIIDSLKENAPEKTYDARKQSFEYLEGNGYIKRNENRSVDGDTKLLGNEFQLWGKLGIASKISRSYYTSEKGFNFNWRRISSLLT